jgi:glycosyltransferase involved in cell wall biosynthesis
MGHLTYGDLMRAHFEQDTAAEGEGVRLDFHWSDEEKSLLTRVGCRLGETRLPGGFVRRNNLDLWRYRAEMAYGRMGRRLAERLLARDEYDVLHFHTQVPGLASLSLIRRIPTVITADITAALVATEKGNPPFPWTYAPNVRAEQRIFSAAHRVVFWSRWAYDSFVRDLGMPAEKGAVIHPGVNLQAFASEEWAAARATGERPVRLLFVGGDFERKGGHDLLAAYRKAGLGGRAELHLVTATPVEADPPHVHVYHGVTAYSPEWLALYRDADAFVFPTHYDGLGIAVMEAAAAGLATLSTRVNAIPEMVEDGATGFLIPSGNVDALADRLTRLASDADLRARMGREARRVAEQRFDYHVNFARLGQVFWEAAQSRR